jgi:hypothetical protein
MPSTSVIASPNNSGGRLVPLACSTPLCSLFVSPPHGIQTDFGSKSPPYSSSALRPTGSSDRPLRPDSHVS